MATSTPWGSSQYSKVYTKGITFYGTAGHGGFHVSSKFNEKIPAYMREANGWYEEDCDWAKVAVCFPEFFADQKAHAKKTLADWCYEEYEKFYGVKLKAGESYTKDKARFYKKHANDYISMSAWGDWHEAVPKGFVGVFAGRGGRSNEGYGAFPADSKYFLVPEKEYEKRKDFGFIVNPAKHKEVAAFS